MAKVSGCGKGLTHKHSLNWIVVKYSYFHCVSRHVPMVGLHAPFVPRITDSPVAANKMPTAQSQVDAFAASQLPCPGGIQCGNH